MKKSLGTNAAVAKAWASQAQTEGYSGNLSFKGADLYSYRTIIGHLVNGLAVLSAAKYSITTGRHISEARAAANFNAVFVDNPAVGQAKHNYNAARDAIEKLLLKSAKARTKKVTYLEKAKRVALDFNRYAGAVGELQYNINIIQLEDELLAVKLGLE